MALITLRGDSEPNIVSQTFTWPLMKYLKRCFQFLYPKPARCAHGLIPCFVENNPQDPHKGHVEANSLTQALYYLLERVYVMCKLGHTRRLVCKFQHTSFCMSISFKKEKDLRMSDEQTKRDKGEQTCSESGYHTELTVYNPGSIRQCWFKNDWLEIAVETDCETEKLSAEKADDILSVPEKSPVPDVCCQHKEVTKPPKGFTAVSGLLEWRGILIFLSLISLQGGMASDVVLSSTLGATLFALPEDPVVFSCTTRGSFVVEWFSDEYIGTGGDGISLLSFNCLNSNVTSDVYLSTQATCVNVTTENGVTVIESVLRIIAAVERPIATVICTNNDAGSRESITFQTLEPVVLTSTLDDGSVAYPGREIVFTCITRNSHVVEWFSDEYIGTGGDGISLLSFNCLNSNVTSDAYPSTRATCVSVTTESGVTMIESRLYITISAIEQTATVTCSNKGMGSRVNKTFHTAVQQFNKTTEPDAMTITVTTPTTVLPDAAGYDGDIAFVRIGIPLIVVLLTLIITVTMVTVMILWLKMQKVLKTDKNIASIECSKTSRVAPDC